MRNQLSLFKKGKLAFPEDVEVILQRVIEKMSNEKIEIEGWCLDEHPLDTIFCFYHPENKKAFDILVTKAGNLVPYYSGEEDENRINSFPAMTIKEAIEKYKIE
jgi:hypothetical protein